MVYRDKPDELAGEEYEMPEQGRDVDPLLPQYEQYSEPSEPSTSRTIIRTRRRGRPLLCACIALAVVLPYLALGACLLHSARGNITSWSQVPDSMKDWIKGLWPGSVHGYNDKDFPIDVGYPGPTPTGKEAALLVTAPVAPLHTHVSPLLPPTGKKEGFNVMYNWGNLSPYHSVKSHGLPESSQLVPDGCELEEMHWLQRHGARYPTSSTNGPAGFAQRIKEASGWKASGDLKFLHGYEYKLGAELLTPFGRSQLYNLGVAARMKYGFLLERMQGRVPVLRTESQDRMLRSAQNWAAGFFGIPDDGQYNLEVMIEAPGFNCSLAPYHSCPNDGRLYDPVRAKTAQWDAIFLKDARKRLQKSIEGYDLTLTDVKEMMDTCAYETVALGYSAFCSLFTDKEWRGYQYRWDIYWWYGASFGSPVARAEGLGWIQELTARLTHTPLTQFNSSVNGTLHDKTHFPVDHPLYIDFTHDTTFAQLLPTMNLTSFAKGGPPPLDHIPKNWPFKSSKFAPFATNLQVQVLNCDDQRILMTANSTDGAGWWPFGVEESEKEQKKRAEDARSRYVRLILNDGIVPLTGIKGCNSHSQGVCRFDAFVTSMQTLIGETDFQHDCYGDYDFDLDKITNGKPVG